MYRHLKRLKSFPEQIFRFLVLIREKQRRIDIVQSQELDAHQLGGILTAAGAEDFAGHVLDDAQDGHLQPFEGLGPAAGVAHCHGLGTGDDDAAGQGHALGQAKLGIAGAGRQIDDQIVQFTPEASKGTILSPSTRGWPERPNIMGMLGP